MAVADNDDGAAGAAVAAGAASHTPATNPPPDAAAQANANTASDANTSVPAPGHSSSSNGTAVGKARALQHPPRSASSSAFASPLSSRDSSPARPRQRTASAAPQAASSSAATTTAAAAAAAPRRKHSADPSPTRNPLALPGVQPTVPSAAAIQRALSATAPPQLQPATTTTTTTSTPSSAEPGARLPRPSRGSGTPAGAEDAAAVKSPALASASSSSSLSSSNRSGVVAAAKKQDPPGIVVQAATPLSATPEMKGLEMQGGATLPQQQQTQQQQNNQQNQQQQQPAGRPLRMDRGVSGVPSLATVEEGSNPSTPSTELGEGESLTRHATAERVTVPTPAAQPVSEPANTTDLSGSEQTTKPTESGSDSAGKNGKTKSDKKPQDPDRTPRAKMIQPKSSYQSLASLKPPKSAAAEPSSRKMTVETETVSAAAQPSSVAGAGSGDHRGPASSKAEGSLRLKPSNETIRPKRERKKQRKAPSINSGTASSKADLFEAKVASAVDDVDSSDSDETFVYESNPPDSQPRRSRHHSRTPSAASMQSTPDPRTGLRSLTGVLNGDRGVSGKRSMKFANNPYSSSGADDEATLAGHDSSRGGTIRPSAGSGVHHHHMSRHNRGFGPAYAAEDDQSTGTSPYSLANKRSGVNSRTSSRPTSPRFANNNSTTRTYNGNGTSRKNELYGPYDLDADGADDERTPLMGTVRTPRSSRTGRLPGNVRLRQLERNEHPRSYWIKRFAGCSIMVIMIALVVMGAIGFFFVTTKPLYDVDVPAIRNVLASEQEIMLDLQVEAVNPNLMTIAINDMDVNVFAKSKHVGSEKWWRDHGMPPPPPESDRKSALYERRRRSSAPSGPDVDADSWFDFPHWTPHHGDDDDDDGEDHDYSGYHPPGSEGDSQMLLLGRVLHFDNALSFDGSPIKRHPHHSVGELRVPHPANRTEAGGTERWERVLEHPFQLIVRGILKYSLPLSTHVIAAPIDASVMVHPEEGPDANGHLVLGATWRRGWSGDQEEQDPFFEHHGPGAEHEGSAGEPADENPNAKEEEAEEEGARKRGLGRFYSAKVRFTA